MKTKTTLILIFAGLLSFGAFCATPQLYALPDPGQFFFRLLIGAAKPNDESYNFAQAGGLAVGALLGEDRQAEIGINLLFGKWNRTFRDSAGKYTGFCNEGVTPVSANYRYNFKILPEHVRAFVGAGVGLQYVDVDANMGPKGYSTYEPDDPNADPNDPDAGGKTIYHPAPGEVMDHYFAFVANATAGISWQLGRGFSAELGYTAMLQNKGIYTLSGGVAGTKQIIRNSSGLTHFIIFAITLSR